MSDFETAARPYAKAVFELANEQDSLQLWSDLLQLASVVATDQSMQALFDMPAVESSDKAKIFLEVMALVEDAPEISAECNNLVMLLAENDRLVAIPDIMELFEAHKQAAEGAIEVRVTSAMKLTAKQQKALAAKLVKKLGKEVSITTEIDKSLIAGAVIHAGDLVIDGSARGQLNKLTTTLAK